ncbi:hypothetical protein [Streptomyces sp. bgisy153]|uniref:hypothetical protein n=1 Tax=Streptomyces sp. bgisy153 TaxID=3413793 RepID=UPI003D719953
MTRRPYHRPPEGRDHDRTERDRVVDVLLARLDRGALSPAEAALLGEHVREYRRLAEENRRAMVGTTRALAKHREAADAAIVEAEQRAKQAEQQLAPVEATLAEVRRRHRGACERVDQLLAVLARVRNAQSLGDVLAAVAEHDGLSPMAARVHARILDRADSTEARLAEQQREHDVALAIERRRVVEASGEARAQRRRAERYRLAWLAARRDRKADRAAMRADLATMQAAEQQLAAVRSALPTEPRPRLGLPNDLAYQHGRHDLADAVRDALDDRA